MISNNDRQDLQEVEAFEQSFSEKDVCADTRINEEGGPSPLAPSSGGTV